MRKQSRCEVAARWNPTWHLDVLVRSALERNVPNDDRAGDRGTALALCPLSPVQLASWLVHANPNAMPCLLDTTCYNTLRSPHIALRLSSQHSGPAVRAVWHMVDGTASSDKSDI